MCFNCNSRSNVTKLNFYFYFPYLLFPEHGLLLFNSCFSLFFYKFLRLFSMYTPSKILIESISTDFSRVFVFVDDSLLPFFLSLALLVLALAVPCLLSPDTSPDDGDVTSLWWCLFQVSLKLVLTTGDLASWVILLQPLSPLESVSPNFGLQCCKGQGFP